MGDTSIIAGAPLLFDRVRPGLDGVPYVIDTVEHSYSKSSGFLTKIDAKLYGGKSAGRPSGPGGLRRVRTRKRAPSHPMHQLGRGQINNNAATALPPVVMIIIPMSVLPCRSRKVGGRSQLYRLTSYTRYPLSDAAHFEPLARIPLLPLRTRGGCRGVLANSSSA